MSNVDKFYDLIDRACMYLNSKTKINYLDALIRVGNDLVDEINESKIEEKDIEVLKKYYSEIEALTLVNDEVRQAMELLIIKAFKHKNISLDLMTPDYICYIFGYLINAYFKSSSFFPTILDVEVGTGNLINAISNFVDMDTNLIGVEHNTDLINLCRVNTELQNNNISLYFQNTLNAFTEMVDIAIGDIDCVEVDGKYMPYEIINNYTHNVRDKGLFMYLVQNDFFSKQGIEKFKTTFKGTFLGLILLPEDLFQKGHIGKSILIGSPRKLKNFDMMVIQMPNLEDTEKFKNNITDINKWIKKVKERLS